MFELTLLPEHNVNKTSRRENIYAVSEKYFCIDKGFIDYAFKKQTKELGTEK